MVSVILNVYKRPYTLEHQIEAVKKQSIPVKSEDIHVWYNNVDDLDQPNPKDPKIKTYRCNYNTKFFGRFTIPLLCQTPFIMMLDDDIIPAERWIENCINTIATHNGILGGSGVITNGQSYIPNTKAGWNGSKVNHVTKVDLVGHAWFFRKEWAKFMWLEEPPSWENGEDMFFSYMAQKNGIDTFVPPHPMDNKSLWSNLDRGWGMDKNAHSLVHKNHLPLRNDIVKALKNKGWKTIK